MQRKKKKVVRRVVDSDSDTSALPLSKVQNVVIIVLIFMPRIVVLNKLDCSLPIYHKEAITLY